MKTFYGFAIVILIAALSFSGCKKNSAINESQEVLFQYDYINYAWGYQHNGFFIDKAGNILTYSNPAEWNYPDDNFSVTQSQLHDNISKCVNTGEKINRIELEKYAGYIKNISLSKVTAQKNVAADAGSIQYICYQFSDIPGSYKGHLIKMEGDFTCENLNFYSKKVSAWLKSINDTLGKK